MNQLTLPNLTAPYRLKVVQDNDPVSPREWCNLGTMVCWHRNYTLGDEQPKQYPGEYRLAMAERFEPGLQERLERAMERRFSVTSPQRDVDEYLIEAVDKVLARHIIELPLYLYDHSGITMRTSAFSCPWDSGQVGFIYVPIKQIKAEYGWKVLTKARRQRIYDYLTNEVKAYDDYLTGQVYGFELQQWNGVEWEEEDNCYGFYGDALNIHSELAPATCFTLEQVKSAMRNLNQWVYNTPDAADAA